MVLAAGRSNCPCYAGDRAAGERALAPLRSVGAPIADMVAPITYVAQQALTADAFPYGRQSYWKSSVLHAITDAAIETIIAYAARVPSPFSAILVENRHGAYSRVGATDTAFGLRDAPFSLLLLSSWAAPAETDRNISWTRAFHQAMRPHLSLGGYVNDLDHDEGAERIRASYGGNYARLAALKATYDPTNFFRMNQKITPAQ